MFRRKTWRRLLGTASWSMTNYPPELPLLLDGCLAPYQPVQTRGILRVSVAHPCCGGLRSSALVALISPAITEDHTRLANVSLGGRVYKHNHCSLTLRRFVDLANGVVTVCILVLSSFGCRAIQRLYVLPLATMLKGLSDTR